MNGRALLALVAVAAGTSAKAGEETILQYFETPWSEVRARIPEIAQAGYGSIWLPPPTKGAEGIDDVGFSLFDRFDLGDRDQRGTVRTRYGTKAELRALVDEAHRFGLRVYLDTVVNHNSNPSLVENAHSPLSPVPMDGFPGMHPLDFHVLPARPVDDRRWEAKYPEIFGGGLRVLSPNEGAGEGIVASVLMPEGYEVPGFTHLVRAPWFSFDGPSEAEELHLSLLGLIDIAVEQSFDGEGPLLDDGINLVSELRIPTYVRSPDRPETYPGGQPVAEDVRAYLMRWARWLGDETDCDGLRLDAVKHMPTSFFGRDFPGDPIAFNAVFQENYDARRGHSDRDAQDDAEDALLFGEAFTGDTESLRRYHETGMLLLDFPLLFRLGGDGGVFSRWGDGDIGQLSYPQGGMDGGYAEFGGLGRRSGIAFVQSHDTPAPAAQPNAAYAYALTRVGRAVVFFDGVRHSDRTFVKPGREDALGETGSRRVLDLVALRSDFAAGGMYNRFVDGDYYLYERVQRSADGQMVPRLLVAVTDRIGEVGRFGEFDPRPLVVTAFSPGTELVEMTGNGGLAAVTVLDPEVVPEAARARALAAYERASDFPPPPNYGLLYLEVPPGPDRGYLAYAPARAPREVDVLDAQGAPLPTTELETAPARRRQNGATVPPSILILPTVAVGAGLQVRASSLGADWTPALRIDDGRYGVGGTMRRAADGGGWIAEIDAALPEGVHLATVTWAHADGVETLGARTLFRVGDAPPVVSDGGVGDAGVGAPDAGGPDGGVSSVDSDPDRDGVPSEVDGCPEVHDPEQLDFDGDGRGNACDFCPESKPGAVVDEEGCRRLSDAQRGRLAEIVEAILTGTESERTALDVNTDGQVNVLDFVLVSEGEQ